MAEGFCSKCKDCKIAVENCEEYNPIVTCKNYKEERKYAMGVIILKHVQK